MRFPAGYSAAFGRLTATRQRRLLLVDGLVACALLEAPIAGLAGEALAAAPLLTAGMVTLHVAAALRPGRTRA